MQKQYQIPQKIITIFGYIVFLISIFLVVRELLDFFTLPSQCKFLDYQGVDFVKYKEKTLSFMYLYVLSFLMSIGLIKRYSIGWIILNALLLIGLLYFVLFCIININVLLSAVFYVYFIPYSLFFVFMNKYLYDKKTTTEFQIKKKYFIYYFLISLAFSLIYFVILFYIQDRIILNF